MRQKDLDQIGSIQVENDSRFVLTKRNDSMALDAKEMNLNKKKKSVGQTFEADFSDHNGLEETESEIMSDRIFQT